MTYDLDPEKLSSDFLDPKLAGRIDPGSLSGNGSLCVAEITFYLLENGLEIKFKVQGKEITEKTTMTNSKFDELVAIPTIPATK